MNTPSQLAGSGIDEAACAAYLATIEDQARVIETPCGEGTMTWRVWGAGEPLVMTHGSHGDWTHLVRNVEALAACYRVIVADLPGHGTSAEPLGRTNAEMAVHTAQGLPHVLDPGERANFVGFSLGGVHLTWLAAKCPDVVKRLVLIGVGGLDTPVGDIDLVTVRGLTGKERAAAHRRNLLGLMLHHPESVDDLAIWLSDRSQARTQFRQSDYEVMPDHVMRALPGVTAQVDAIWGALDRAHPDPAYQLEALRKGAPDARMRVVPEAGHWVPYERAERFNAELLDLLAEPLRPRP